MNRRTLVAGLGSLAAASAPSAVEARPATYADALRQVWRPLDPAGGPRELVRAATLAANSHNTQPWRFSLNEKRVVIRPDPDRRCPAVDPDDHHLFASLGCAAENMVQTAGHLGFTASPHVDESGSGAVVVDIERSTSSPSGLADAVTRRQCTRGIYDGRPVSMDDLRMMAHAASVEGVDCMILTERATMEAVLDYVIQGNTAQMRDPAFMAELISWIRFSDAMAIDHGDGLSARSSGNPSVPGWLARRLLRFVFTERGENDKYASHVRSSAGLAVFFAPTDDKAGWVTAGRAYQRFALQATALDIRHAFLNQPLEVLALRPQLATYLGRSGQRPNLLVRFGRGPLLPASLRRPVSAVLEAA